ncbi:MAG: hypothetical protein H6668_20830 [Ardenticatenaceae bacterium]|nr:hypothetical protein [Ardenticatenaceae bacterium]
MPKYFMKLIHPIRFGLAILCFYRWEAVCRFRPFSQSKPRAKVAPPCRQRYGQAARRLYAGFMGSPFLSRRRFAGFFQNEAICRRVAVKIGDGVSGLAVAGSGGW